MKSSKEERKQILADVAQALLIHRNKNVAWKFPFDQQTPFSTIGVKTLSPKCKAKEKLRGKFNEEK